MDADEEGLSLGGGTRVCFSVSGASKRKKKSGKMKAGQEKSARKTK